MVWTDEQAARLKQLRVTDGLTYGVIAERMGMTRSQVISKAMRLGLRHSLAKAQSRVDRRARSEVTRRAKRSASRFPRFQDVGPMRTCETRTAPPSRTALPGPARIWLPPHAPRHRIRAASRCSIFNAITADGRPVTRLRRSAARRGTTAPAIARRTGPGRTRRVPNRAGY